MNAETSTRTFRGAVSNERTRLRQSQRARIEAFFERRIAIRFSSSNLHLWFGSSFRTRVSEINRDARSRIRIVNETSAARDEAGVRREQSFYWAELAPKVSWPATPEQLEGLGYVYLGGKECDCGESFLWWRTPAGKAMPISVIEGNRLVPHHVRCKNVGQFRAANAKHRARGDPRPMQAALF